MRAAPQLLVPHLELQPPEAPDISRAWKYGIQHASKCAECCCPAPSGCLLCDQDQAKAVPENAGARAYIHIVHKVPSVRTHGSRTQCVLWPRTGMCMCKVTQVYWAAFLLMDQADQDSLLLVLPPFHLSASSPPCPMLGRGLSSGTGTCEGG